MQTNKFGRGDLHTNDKQKRENTDDIALGFIYMVYFRKMDDAMDDMDH